MTISEIRGAQEPLPFPSQFRRRLTIAFVVVAGVSSGLLALGAFLFVNQQRHDSFVERARQQAGTVFALTRGEASADRLDALIRVPRERSGFDSLVVADRTIGSRSDLQVTDLPKEVTSPDGERASAFFTFAGEPFFVIARDVPNSVDDARLYLLFSEREVREGLNDFRQGLVGGWIITTLGAALVGNLIAKRTLSPVRQSADAARSLAEGLLHTRLAAGGRDEFGAWARTFNDMAEALEMKLEQLSAAHEREKRFTADVAHDLRTPVTAMVSVASILKSKLDHAPDDMRRPIELLVADVERLRKLITDLLELGQLDAEDQVARPEPVELQSLVQRVVELSSQGHDSAEPDVIVDVPNSIVMVDRVRLERVLLNLVRNAIVHGGGQISVSADVRSNEAEICVADHGPGIPEDQLSEIFDRFHKANVARSNEGSGLGLAIVAQHVRIMGGEVTARNRLSHRGGSKPSGAVFCVRLPLSES